MRRFALLAIVAALMTVVFAAPASAHDYNCGDFDAQIDAQVHLYNHGGADPDNLDGDDDGEACEEYDYSDGGSSTDTGGGGSTDTVGTTQLPTTGTGGYLSENALGMSPMTLLTIAMVSGVALVSGGFYARRSLR